MKELNTFRQFLAEGSDLGQKLAAVIKNDIGQGESDEYDMLLTRYANLIKNASNDKEAYKLLVKLSDKIGEMTGDRGADSNYLDAANINLEDYGIVSFFRQYFNKKNEGSELGQKLAAVIRDDIGQGESIGYDRLLTRIATAMENASDNAEAYDLLIDLANDIGKMTGDFGADSNYLDAANINLKDYGINITEGNDLSSYESKVDWYYIESNSNYPGPKNRTVPDAEGFDSPKKFKGTELYIKKGTKGKVKDNKFEDEEGNDVEYIAKYFKKI